MTKTAQKQALFAIAMIVTLGAFVLNASGCELLVNVDVTQVDGGVDGGVCTLCVDGMVVTDEAGNQTIVPLANDAGANASDASNTTPSDATAE